MQGGAAPPHETQHLSSAPCPSCRNGYQKFSQELLSNGELNHLPLKERMVEIGSRWQRISQGQKDHYKKLAEEQQKQYKVHLDIWLKVSAGRRHSSRLRPEMLTLPVGRGAAQCLHGIPWDGAPRAAAVRSEPPLCLCRASRPRSGLPTRNTPPT